MVSTIRTLATLAVCQVFWMHSASLQAQSPATSGSGRAARVAELAKKLRWHDQVERQRYLASRDSITDQIFQEIDGFIAETFAPNTVRASNVKPALEALLPGTVGDSRNDVAFVVNLLAGRFLIAGVELSRGGNAIAEDAISIRAYKDVGAKLALVAQNRDLRSSDRDNPFLTNLHARSVVPAPPIPGEFWLLVWAQVPPQAPPSFAMRLYAFNGEKIRTVWAPADVVAENGKSVVEIASGGFTIHRLVDKSGVAPHSPTTVVHERYALTVEGPLRTSTWETDLR